MGALVQRTNIALFDPQYIAKLCLFDRAQRVIVFEFGQKLQPFLISLNLMNPIPDIFSFVNTLRLR